MSSIYFIFIFSIYLIVIQEKTYNCKFIYIHTYTFSYIHSYRQYFLLLLFFIHFFFLSFCFLTKQQSICSRPFQLQETLEYHLEGISIGPIILLKENLQGDKEINEYMYVCVLCENTTTITFFSFLFFYFILSYFLPYFF